MYKTIDICAGIGGIRKGFTRTGHYENVCSVEKDRFAADTYQHLYGEVPLDDITSDDVIRKIANMKYDILLAGFPCQPFSSQGQKLGFNDATKGTIFYYLQRIISETRPKAVFLENVQNIVSHDGGNTIYVIVDTLERLLNYKVVGVETDEEGAYYYDKDSFVRNTKNFGLPQNRPRAFFVAFDRELYGDYLNEIDDELPRGLCDRIKNSPYLNHKLNDIIEKNVSCKYYLSQRYLNTLKEHSKRQKKNGNGFGFYVLNSESHHREYSNTILATGGSGKERNLIIQEMTKKAIKEEQTQDVSTNDENIRAMTPTEWGRLQGFIGYAFIDPETGDEGFSFPDNISDTQKYKQFGNSVSIPVVETLAEYMYTQIRYLNDNHFEHILRVLENREGYICRKNVGECLDVKGPRASYIISRLEQGGLIRREGTGKNTVYHFVNNR